MSRPLRIASRPSPLAMWQAHTVGKMLDREYEIIEVKTTGDVRRDVSIIELGGIGAFAKEIQVCVLEGGADIALHSGKDLPSQTPDGLDLVSIPLRGDVRDVLIGSTLENLPYGARVGTGAQRRRAQLAAIRPDLQFEELRGNIGTRLEKASRYDAIVLAHAALQRLNREEEVTEILSVDVMLPQVAQGALAIEVRVDDDESQEISQRINDPDAFRCVTAERAFLETLGGGCSVPCAAYATTLDADTIWLRALLADPRGREVLRVEQKGVDPRELGISVARELLDDKGGEHIMDMVAQ
jgi:hydroxymethylbilane synthase